MSKKMTDEEIVAEQQEFIKWMKKHKIYNEWASAASMREAHKVWKVFKKQGKV
jgi:hypothetical protein